MPENTLNMRVIPSSKSEGFSASTTALRKPSEVS